jgi:hypothetical protein
MADETPKKPQVINLEDDSSDEDKTPAKTGTGSVSKLTSPFAAYAKNSGPTDLKEYGQIWNIVPAPVVEEDENNPRPLRGVVISCIGKGVDYPWVQPVFKQMPWVPDEGVLVKRPFVLKVNGEVQKQTNHKYDRRMLVWIYPEDMPNMSQESATFVYGAYMNACVHKGILKTVPPIHPDIGYTELTSWQNTITMQDLQEIWENIPWLNAKYQGVKTFLKYSRNNLYSIYNIGTIPIDIMKQFKLRATLHDKDSERLNAGEVKHELKEGEVKLESAAGSISPHKAQGLTTGTAGVGGKNLNKVFESESSATSPLEVHDSSDDKKAPAKKRVSLAHYSCILTFHSNPLSY